MIGGTGFIGRALTRALVARGHDVRVLSRGRTGPFDDIADHVETVGASLYDEEALRDLVTEIVRQELQGGLGERITRNVRKLVRREIHRALASQELE